jgi:hypothetical protein
MFICLYTKVNYERDYCFGHACPYMEVASHYISATTEPYQDNHNNCVTVLREIDLLVDFLESSFFARVDRLLFLNLLL